MDPRELQLRTLLIDIGDKLSINDRNMFCFLLGGDVPRRDLDTVTQDSRASMGIIWDTLINREKITVNNVDYLIHSFKKIGRIDIAQKLRQYTTASASNNQMQQANNPMDLFNRIEPS